MIYLGQILEQACLMFPLVLGIYLSFSILRIADLSVDGTLLLGAAVFAKLTSSGVSLTPAILIAVVAGVLAGIATAFIQRHNRIDPLIAGILMAFILNSLSLVIMQRPNIPLIGIQSSHDRIMVLAILIPILSVIVGIFLRSHMGLWLKAFGNNQELVGMLGRNPELFRTTGLAISNGLAALSGCLIAIASGYADINMGIGQALIGIAMVLIGYQILLLFKKRDLINDFLAIASTFVGVVLYFLLINEIIRLGLNPVYLKMAIGALLIIFLLLADRRAFQTRKITT